MWVVACYKIHAAMGSYGHAWAWISDLTNNSCFTLTGEKLEHRKDLHLDHSGKFWPRRPQTVQPRTEGQEEDVEQEEDGDEGEDSHRNEALRVCCTWLCADLIVGLTLYAHVRCCICLHDVRFIIVHVTKVETLGKLLTHLLLQCSCVLLNQHHNANEGKCYAVGCTFD
jgi:hypothetical protein